MTWKQFKEAVEAQGVTDDSELAYIDVTLYGETRIDVGKLHRSGEYAITGD